MRKIFLIDLEKVPSRYTWEWHSHFPKTLVEAGFSVTVVGDPEYQVDASAGGFLNFIATNKYKALQVNLIADLFINGEVDDDSIFLFADAWHPGVINTKYMIDLYCSKARIAGLWHAGSYIDEDILGQRIKDKSWSYATEQAIYHAIDFNMFATAWHLNHFERTLGVKGKSYLTGWPMSYVKDIDFPKVEKRNQVVFPHRISPEKHVEVFDALATILPQYEFVACQRQNMSKQEYHLTLAQSKVMFSAATLETLGICQVEAMAAGCLPLVPDRLSYSEMYMGDKFLYPDGCSIEDIAGRIIAMVEGYDSLMPEMTAEYERQFRMFFNCDGLIQVLK